MQHSWRLFLILAAATAPALAGPPLPTAEWLVHLARDHGLNRAGQQNPSDVAHCQTLLKAGLRLNPEQPLALYWLYEIANLQGDDDRARGLLEQIVRLQPENQTAYHRWLLGGAAAAGTAEKRQAWLRQQLAAASTGYQRGLVEIELANGALERIDRASAAEHFERARTAAPYLPDLGQLELALLSDDAPREVRLAVYLRALAHDPVQVEVAWRVGQLLDGCGLAEQAGLFYDHAYSVHEATTPGGDIPPFYLRELARNAMARGDRTRAMSLAKRAAAEDKTSYESSFFLHWLFTASEQNGQASLLARRLAERFSEVKEPEDWRPELLAPIAWFYCVIDPQPQRATLLAESAARRAPDDPYVARVLGWAQALAGEDDAAISTLSPLAERDPLAAARLAELLAARDQHDDARAVVDGLERLPVAGLAVDRISKLELGNVRSLPVEERYLKVQAVLTDFDQRVLNFHRAPWNFLEAEVEMDDLSPPPGETWWATLKLTNRSGTPISLGPNLMVNPVFLLSFEAEGDKERSYPHLMTISVDGRRVLEPGETVSVRRTIDIGPLRKLARRTPQQLQRFTISGILDPQQDSKGNWVPSGTGQELPTISFNRRPTLTTREAWNALFSGLSSEQPAAAYRSVDVLAGLLAEGQYARLGRLSYQPESIPDERIRELLRAALESRAWQLRVRALEALQWTGLDRELLDAVEACLTHEHWCVRMMAVRLLGSRLGTDFAERARRISAADQDELVRAMATCMVPSSPAAEPAGE